MPAEDRKTWDLTRFLSAAFFIIICSFLLSFFSFFSFFEVEAVEFADSAIRASSAAFLFALHASRGSKLWDTTLTAHEQMGASRIGARGMEGVALTRSLA